MFCDNKSIAWEWFIGYGGAYIRKSKDERQGLPSLQNPQEGESVVSPYGNVHETLGPLGLYGPGSHSPTRAVAEIKNHQLHAAIHGKEILSEALHQKQKLNAAILESQRHNAAVLDKQLLKADLLEKERVNAQLLDKELYETEVLTKQRLHEAIRDKQRLAAAIFEKERLSEAIREKQRINAAILEKGKVEAALVEKQLLEAAYVNKERLNQALFEKQRLAAAIAEKERLIEDIMSKQRLNAAVYNKQTLHSAVNDKEIGKSLAAIRANEELSHLAKQKLVGTVGSLLNKPLGHGDLHQYSPLLNPLGPGGVFKAAGPPYGAADALIANKPVGIYGNIEGSLGHLYQNPLGSLGATKALAASLSLGGSNLGAAALLKTSANPLFNGGYLGPNKPLLPNYGYPGYGNPLLSKPLAPVAGPGFADYYDYNVAPVLPPKPATVTVITPVYGRPDEYPKQPLQTVVVKDKLPPTGPYGYGYNSPLLHSSGHYFADKSAVGHDASGPAPVVVNQNGGPVRSHPASSKTHGQIVPSHSHEPFSYSYKMMPGSFNQAHNEEGPSILGRVDKLVTSKALGTAYSLIGKALSFTN